MKTTKTKFAVLMLMLILVSPFIKAELAAGNRWKVTAITHPGTLRLTGDDLLFKITIKNTGDKRSRGESITVTAKVKGAGNVIGTKTITVQPDITDMGGSYTFDISVPVSNSMVYQKITCDIQSSDTEGASETFDVSNR